MKPIVSGTLRGLLVFITLLLLLPVTPTLAQTNGRTVYHRDALLDFGVYRPADLFELVPGWNSWSVDGFSHHVSASGLSNYSQERWVLFVDHRRIERGLLGLLDLNMLPIAVQQIDSVEVFSVPTVIAGQWVGHGAIHIYTMRDKDGIDLGGSLYTGNEINDPGPFLYTDYRTANIDRVGPDGNGYLHLASNGFYVAASALYREHHSTDEHIGYRTRVNHDNNNHSPRKLLFTPMVRAGYLGKKADVDFVVTQSTLNDFAYIPGFGAELPMRQTYSSVSAQSSFNLGSHMRLLAGVTATEDFHHGRDNLLAWDPNIKNDALRARTGLHFALATWSLEVGGGADLFRARPFFDVLISDQYRTYRGYANASYTSHSAQTRLATEVTTVAGSILPKINLNHNRNLLSLHASYSLNSILEQQSFWYWMQMGYMGFSSLTPNLVGFDQINLSSMVTADLDLKLHNSERVGVTIHAGLRHTQNDWAAISTITYMTDEIRFKDDLRIVSDLGGLSTTAGVHTRLRTNRTIEHELWGGVQSALRGGDTYRALSREVPRFRGYYGVRYLGVPGFTMAGRFSIQSPTEWSGFYNTSREGTPFFDGPVVPTQLKLNVYARKTILNERAWAALKFENILNRSLQEWPAGEVRDMTFHLAIGASLKKGSGLRNSSQPFERPLY
jgi:hypothetical protein